MKRRSLCGSSHERCRCAARPEGKRRKQKTTSSIPGAHVGLAARLDLVGLLAGQVQHDRDVVRAERPQRVLVRAQLAEVEAVGVDVVDLAELAGVGDLLQLARRPGGTRAGGRPSARARSRSAAATARSASATDWASGFSTKQCLPASSTRSASAAWVGTGVASTTASSVWVGEQVVEVGGEARARERARAALARGLGRVAAPGELAARQRGEVAREVRAPVAEAGDPHSDRHAPILRAAATTRSPARPSP